MKFICQLMRVTLIALICATLANCSAKGPPKIDEAQVRQFTVAGYHSGQMATILFRMESADIDGVALELAWSLPVSGNLLPVVAYLPGLGESPSAGDAWRTSWAQAGYAVLSVQPLLEDRQAWSTTAAHRGDFYHLARQRFGTVAAAKRLQILSLLLDGLRGGRVGDPVMVRRLDLSKVALAGYDLGAYTAMLAAGETPDKSWESPKPSLSVQAVIALSPFADFSGKGFGSRYQGISGAVLSVSGDVDFDPTGVVPTPTLRKAPFQNMPSHDAYLLWLPNGTHRLLSGTQMKTAEEEKLNGSDSTGDAKGQHKGKGKRAGQDKESDAIPVGDETRGRARLPSATDRALNTALINGVTTAFLDAYVKHDSVAMEWMHRDAGLWMDGRGQLLHK